MNKSLKDQYYNILKSYKNDPKLKDIVKMSSPENVRSGKFFMILD